MKVKDVLNEIEQLKKDANILKNIHDKMWNDQSFNDYMRTTFGIRREDILRISHRTTHQVNILQNELDEHEVNIQL